MSEKPIAFWVALGATMLYVIGREKDQPWLTRSMKAVVSGGIAFALAPELAAWTGRSETLAAVVITAFGPILLDVVGTAIGDPTLWRDILRKRLGGGKDE